MTKIIIGIHGLSNKPEKSQLKEWWKAAMLEGLEKNAGISLSELPFESVYWADVTYPQHDPNPDAYRTAEPGALKRYDDGWLDIVKNKFRDIGGDTIDLAKKWFGMDKIAEEVLARKLPDLSKYYEDASVRNELRGRLKAAIKNNRSKRIMVAGHSMGSIVAYDTLRLLGQEDASLAIDHFVTIGSPLGMPHVKYKIAQEGPLVRTPSIVKQWTNLADRRDPVAIDPQLAGDYKANADGVRVKDDLVLNDWGGIHHKSYGYLRTPEFSDLLKTFI